MAAEDIIPKHIFRPEYIRFLLDPTTPINFHVNVKNPTTDEMEQIKAVRWMLIARSKVLRVMLLESKLKTGNEFDITDLDPETFRHFLTYIYGHDNTGSLQFEEAVKLLCAAEKYDVEDLKSKLATGVTQQLTVDNVCTVLQHGRVCDTVPALWEKATETVMFNTELIFKQENFLNLSPEAVVFILQLDALNVREIEIWQAALKWAHHQLYMNNGLPTPQSLRMTMVPLLKHTRLCTLTPAELCMEVAPTQILTAEEFNYICLSATEPNYASSLVEVSSRTDKREMEGVRRGNCVSFPIVKTLEMKGIFRIPSMVSSYNISTKRSKIELQSVEFMARSSESRGLYNCKAEVQVFESDTSDLVEQISFSEEVPFNNLVAIPLNVQLKARTKYNVEVKFSSNHLVIYYKSLKGMKTSTDSIVIEGVLRKSRELRWSHIRNWYYKIVN